MVRHIWQSFYIQSFLSVARLSIIKPKVSVQVKPALGNLGALGDYFILKNYAIITLKLLTL
jgi:hypothetical protein